MKKKYRLTTCNICGSQAPSNFMVRAQKKVTATSRNTVGGKEIIGSLLGSKTSQRALTTSLLTSRKRTHTTFRTVWMCEECSGQKSIGSLEKESLGRERTSLLDEGNRLAKDSKYLASTKLPKELENLKMIKNEYENKANKLDAVMRKGFDSFQKVREIYDDIKSEKALNFAKEVLENKEILKDIENFQKKKENYPVKFTSKEKAEFEITLNELQNQIDDEVEKLGTRWEDKRLISSLEHKREKLINSLKLDSERVRLEKSSRLSRALISQYKDSEHLVKLFNEKHADINFDENNFLISRFAYKDGILERGIFEKPSNVENFDEKFEKWKKSKNFNNSSSVNSNPKSSEVVTSKKIKFWTWWLILFFPIHIAMIFAPPLGQIRFFNALVFVLFPILRILYLKYPNNKFFSKKILHLVELESSLPGAMIHFKVSTILKKHLENCIQDLNLHFQENDQDLDFEEFDKFNTESSLANEELSEVTAKLELQESIISEDMALLENINNRVKALTNSLKILNSKLA